MYKSVYSLVIFFLLTGTVFAQRRMQEVIYLKNGSVIRNISELAHVDSLIRVTTADGSVFVFGPADLQKMSREPRYPVFKESGYLLNLEWGILSGRQSVRNSFNGYREASTVPSFSLVNGYRFNRFLGVGLGAGIDVYDEGVITPLFIRGNGYLFKARFSPLYTIDAGYGFYSHIFNGKESNTFYRFEYRGGPMLNLAGGVQVFLGRNTSFFTTIGYRLQDYRYEVNSEQLQSREVERILFRRMGLRMGFSF